MAEELFPLGPRCSCFLDDCRNFGNGNVQKRKRMLQRETEKEKYFTCIIKLVGLIIAHRLKFIIEREQSHCALEGVRQTEEQEVELRHNFLFQGDFQHQMC